jgi:hypothetical protein
MIMEVLLSFIIKNIEGYTDRKIQKDFPEDMPFIDVIQEILKIINSNITLDKIAVISAVKGLFTYDDIRKSVKEIVDLHLLKFTITKRDLVNGSNLMLKDLISTTSEEDSSKDMQFGYLKPKIEPEAPPQPEAIPDLKPLESKIKKEKLEDFGSIGGKSDQLAGELQLSEMDKLKSTRNELDDAKEAIDRMEEMLSKPSDEDQILEAKISLRAMDSVVEKELEPDSREDFNKPSKQSLEKEKTLPPPKLAPLPLGSAPGGPPKSPPNRHSEVTEDLKKIFSETLEKKKIEPPRVPPAAAPAPPPSAGMFNAAMEAPDQDPTPIPPPSPPPSSRKGKTSSKPYSLKEKKKSKKAAARMRSLSYDDEDSALVLDETPKEEGIVEDFGGIMEEAREVEKFEVFEEAEETEEIGALDEVELPSMEPLPSLKSALVPALSEVAKDIETSKEYQKNIAIEYFDKMNPKKYYPLIIDISDIEQATTISEENILTGERKVQVKEKMAVVLKSSIVKVKPMFPGCSIVPEERYTDLDKKEDKLTFYVTPLVDDEIEAGRIEFIDSEGNIFHSASTPTKVEDPRFARVIALYGGLVSFLPKILELLGFSFTQDTQMATLLPFLQNVLGDMNLSNFIGISGILITIIICVITVAVRKPNSVKKKFKVARVGRLKSAIKAQK